MLANLIFCFEQFEYPRGRCQLVVLDDAGQFPDQPAGENWMVVSRRERFPTLGDKRNALAEMAPKNTDAFVVMDDDDAYLPWTLRAHAWALRQSELSCPDRVLLEDFDSTLVMERVQLGFHASWAYSRDLFLRCGRYPSINRGEDRALLNVMIAGGAEPMSGTDAWPPWLISRWDGTSSYHMSALQEHDYESLRQPAECEQVVQGMQPVPLRDWLAAAMDFFGFGDRGWRARDFQQAWQSQRERVERTMIENRKRIAALRRQRDVDDINDPRS
jgi:hypothetical protein